MKLPTSACLNLKYGTSKEKLKMFKTLILVIFSVKLNILPNHDGIYRSEKFRSKFNHGFTNYSCLHCAILKA